MSGTRLCQHAYNRPSHLSAVVISIVTQDATARRLQLLFDSPKTGAGRQPIAFGILAKHSAVHLACLYKATYRAITGGGRPGDAGADGRLSGAAETPTRAHLLPERAGAVAVSPAAVAWRSSLRVARALPCPGHLAHRCVDGSGCGGGRSGAGRCRRRGGARLGLCCAASNDAAAASRAPRRRRRRRCWHGSSRRGARG